MLGRTNGKAALLLDYAQAELSAKKESDSRVIVKGSHFIALVPFWASWPFETMIVPFKSVPLALLCLLTN